MVSAKSEKTNKPSTVRLSVTLEGTAYVLGTLSFNEKKGECSYHFTYPQDAAKIHFCCDTGEKTARLDHITWHKNTVHIKREDNVKVEPIELSDSLFCGTPAITPFYLETFYFTANEPSLAKTEHSKPWKGGLSQEILSLTQSDGFSVLFVLVPSAEDTASILVGLQFKDLPEGMEFPPCLLDLCDQLHLPGRIRLWGGWDLLVVTSPGKCRILSPIPEALGECYRLPNYKNVPAALTDLLMQANDLVRVDLGLVKNSNNKN